MDDGDLERLRERLYRPDPPPDAADAYRSALTALHPAAPPALAAGRGRRALVLPVIALLAGGAAVAAGIAAVPPVPPLRAASAPVTPVPVRDAQFAAGLAPPPLGGAVLAERTSADPPGAVQVDAGGRVVTLAVLCEVDGIVTVHLGARDSRWFLCTKDGPSLALARSSEPLGRFTLTVQAPTDVVWSLSVAAGR